MTIKADPGTIAPSTISINGVDYTPEDAQSLVELGTKTRDLEKQWDTPVDKVWPEFGKTREELKTTQSERDAMKAELEEFKAKQAKGVETPDEIKEAQENARKLGLTLNEDLEKSGYIKKEDLPELFKTFAQEQEEVRKLLSNAEALEKEIDGTDGRPAFNKKVVLAYANSYNIPDLKEAYEDMHKSALDAWKAAQIEAEKAKKLKTLGGGGDKKPAEGKVNDDNMKELLHEKLYGGQE